MNSNELFLELQRFQVVRDGHQVRFGRQTIGGMPPISGAKETELLARDQCADAVLYTLEVLLTRNRPIGNRLRQLRCLCRVRFQCGDDVHPVQGVKMIEMDDVILDRLRRGDDVAHQARVVRNFDAQRVLDRVDRSQRVNHSTNSADALRPDPGFARVAAPQNEFYATEHRAGTPGVRDRSAFDLRFDAEMPLNSRDRIHHNPRHGFLLRPARLRRFFCFFCRLLRPKFVAHDVAGDLRDHRRTHCRRGNPPNLGRRHIDSEPGHRG